MIWTILLFFAIIGLLAEAGMSRTHAYLDNIVSAQDATKLVNELKAKAPQVSFVMQNYHYEWRVTMRKGRMHTDYVRVNTMSAEAPFRFFEYIDASPDGASIGNLRASKLTRLVFEKDFHFQPQASQSKACQEYQFKADNVKDTHYDF